MPENSIDYLSTAMTITKSNRELLISEELISWLFSQGAAQADKWYNQILPISQLAGFKTIFKETYMQKRASHIRIEFGLNNCKELGNSIPAFNDYDKYFIPPGYEMEEAKGIMHFNSQSLTYDQVFPHPIIISRRFTNIQTGEYKSEVVFYDNGIVKTVIVDSFSVAGNNEIMKLTKIGVRATSNNAKFLVDFLASFVDVNIEKIPILKSTSILGWCNEDFLPYSQDIKLEAKDEELDNVLSSIKCVGNFDLWKKSALESMNNDYVRLYVATSFASPLVSLLKKPIFITHLWGKTGTAKTVALYLALSVFGHPVNMTCQWNGTPIGCEQKTITLNNIPFGMNESELLQGGRNHFASFSEFIYMFCEGRTRDRGKKDGGNVATQYWHNTCLSNGEGSLINEQSKGGELNRVLEFMTDDMLFKTEEKAIEIANMCKENYGYAGKLFTEKCKNYDLKAHWSNFFQLAQEYATGKQAGQMASLLLGDMMMKVIIYDFDENTAYNDSIELFDRVKSNLKTDKDVDLTARAEEFLMGWIAQNTNNFIGATKHNSYSDPAQIYGAIGDNNVYIIANVFNKLIAENGYNLGKIKKDFKSRGIFCETSENSVTIKKRIKNFIPRCYVFKLNKSNYDYIKEADFGDQSYIDDTNY